MVRVRVRVMHVGDYMELNHELLAAFLVSGMAAVDRKNTRLKKSKKVAFSANQYILSQFLG